MEFPLKPDFFPPVRLTSDDRQRYVATAEYSVHVLRKLVADDNWKRISETKGVTVGKVHCIEEQPYGGGSAAAHACLIVCATAFATGSVSEVLEAIASPVTDDYRRAMSFLYKDRFIDGVCLHTISPHGSRNTQAFTTIKWAAFKDGIPLASAPKPHNPVGIDYCFLEHSGIQRDADTDEAFGFCIQESVTRDSEVPIMAGFGMSRGELHRTGILVLPTDRKDLVQISSVLQMDTASALTKSALEKLMIRRVTAVARIPLLLDRRRLSRMQFLPRENWVRDQERRVCAVCTKTFGLRRKHHCRNCGEVVCGTCAPPREVDVTSYGVASIRICTACVVQSRTNGTQHGAQQDEVLVYHLRQTLCSQAGSSNSDQSHQSDYEIGDDLDQEPRNSSSSDSNFSISSNDDDDDDRRRTHRQYEQDAYDFEQDEYRYEHSDPIDRGDSQYEHYEPVDRDGLEFVSIAGGAPHELDETPMRYSDFSARSSGLSFSDFNTLHDDTLRITSVTTNKASQHQSHMHQPPVERRRHVPVAFYQPEEKPVKHMLYTPVDLENKAPNQVRESMDEWFGSRMHHQPLYVEQSPQPQQRKMPSQRSTTEFLDEWSSLRPPSNANSHTSTASIVTRESMDDWFGGRRRERNLSHVSSTSTASGGSRNGGFDSKRSSSSASSSSSILEMLSSIREIQADLASVHHPTGKSMDVRRQQMQEQYPLERLSEQLREAEITNAPPMASGRPPVGARPGNRSSELSSRTGSSRGASTVDIDLLNSDSFSLICPESLQRQQFAASASSHRNQEAGERRSARASNLSTSTVLEDVDDLDSMRQSELMSLRMQVEGLHKSLKDATNKLNYFTARAMVREQADTLEREVMELRSTERRQRKLSDAVDPVVVGHKKQYNALIEELHEIMGLPALSTPVHGEELP